MRRRALEAANRQGAETSTDGTARAPMPWFLQELRQHCRRRLVERSAAGNHNTAILLPRRGKVLASKTPRCHRPPFSPLFRDGPGGVVGKVSVDRFCDQDALFVSQRLCAHFNRGEVLGSVRQTVGTNEERWLSAELFSV
jgi:hypothetical protein